MKFEWDENKNKINLQKHGVSFEEARTGVIKSARLNKMAEFALIYDHVY